MDLVVSDFVAYRELRPKFLTLLSDPQYLDEWNGAKARAVEFITQILGIDATIWANATPSTHPRLALGFELYTQFEFLHKLVNPTFGGREAEVGSYSSPTGERVSLSSQDLLSLSNLCHDVEKKAMEYLAVYQKNYAAVVGGSPVFNWKFLGYERP